MRYTNLKYRSTPGFTILEVLVALTASLFLMLGLTRAFKLIGDKITSSQSELKLSGDLRDVTFRLRDELRRLTPSIDVPLKPGNGGGYLHYYEGPWTDATTTLVHGVPATNPAPDVRNYHPTSRFGDLDDYLAFTTKSDPDKPFSGFVPAGIIEAFRLERHLAFGNAIGAFRTLSGKTVGSAGTFNAVDASAQVVAYSDTAEICYFVAPQWTRSALGVPTIADPTSGLPAGSSPTFVDIVNEAGTGTAGDGIPDRMTLHRRILLVRQDLNMTISEMNKLNNDLGAGAVADAQINFDDEQLPYLTGTQVVPLSSLAQFNPGGWATAPGVNSPNWLAGMARVHQWMDLSISRHISNVSVGDGTPVTSVRANTLEELAIPDNRFAAVRMPVALLNANTLAPFTGNALPLPAGVTSSMPMLALSPPHDLITAAAGGGFIPTTASDPLYNVMGGQAAASAATHPFAMVGFVRPEFSLADHWHDFGVPTVARPTLRGGSDIVMEDVLGFDVQVFDPDAVVAIWTGPDGQPGAVGINDDGDVDAMNMPIIDNTSELGYAATDDVLVDIGSKGMRTALNFNPPTLHPTTTVTNGAIVPIPYGAFVDNGYVRVGGGSLGGNTNTRLTANLAMRSLFITTYSGMRAPIAPSTNSFALDWQNSGKFLLSSGPVPSFYQPSIDTWTSTYDDDPFVQTDVAWPTSGVSTAPLAFTGNLDTNSARSRYWTSDRTAFVPENQFESAPTTAGLDFSEADPPAAVMPRALKITVRAYDRGAGEVRQQTIIEYFSK